MDWDVALTACEEPVWIGEFEASVAEIPKGLERLKQIRGLQPKSIGSHASSSLEAAGR